MPEIATKPLVPAVRIAEIRRRTDKLAAATECADLLAKLFLLHCACKDCLAYVPETETEQAQPIELI